jgi:serine/threonine protein kinase
VNTITATLADGRTVKYLPEIIGEGGMKRVYFTEDKQSVICLFKDQAGTTKDPSRVARLESILGRFNPTTHPTVGKYFTDLFCWPTGIVTKPELGIMTPAYPGCYFFASGNFKGKEKNGRWYSSPKLRKMLPNDEIGSWLGYLMLCKRMARAIRKMHMTGLAHSDLSCNNVLLNPSHGTCIVIDIDSLVVPGVFPPDVLGTPGYLAPEVLGTNRLPVTDPNRKLPSNLTDLHALPVLFYEYLLRRHPLKGPKVNSTTSTEEDEFFSMGSKAIFIENPHDTSNHWSNSKDWPELKPTYDILGKALQDLFYKAFVEGLHNPKVRPTADQWERALYISEDMLIPCGNKTCPEQWFIYIEGKTPRCPWCGWKLDHPIPVLEFQSEWRKGQFRSEGHSLVCWDGRDLYKWHVFSNIQPVEGVDTQVQARVQYYKGQWILWNLNLDSMVSPAGNPVPKKSATLLKNGDEIILSKSEKGRLVSVKLVS